MNTPDLSIIIVTWNCRDDVLRCLAAVEAHSDDLHTEAIVVDNASEDGTVEAVRGRFPAAQVIANELNLGFPRANNVGLAVATGRNILLLNPDTEVGPGTLAECCAELDADPGLGAVGCALTYADGSIQYGSARRAYRLRYMILEAFYLHVLFPHHPVFAHHLIGEWDHRDSRDVEAISGAFFMTPRRVMDAVGGVPDEVFMYHEDLALCLRVRALGLRIRYRADVWTAHYHGQSSRKSNLPLNLLEGPVQTLLIRERSGVLMGWAARVLFAFRGAVRLGFALVGRIIPGLRGFRERNPKVFAADVHLAQVAWALAPWTVAHRIPRAPDPPTERTRSGS